MPMVTVVCKGMVQVRKRMLVETGILTDVPKDMLGPDRLGDSDLAKCICKTSAVSFLRSTTATIFALCSVACDAYEA